MLPIDSFLRDFAPVLYSILALACLAVFQLPFLAGTLQRKGKREKEIFYNLQARQFMELYFVLGTVLVFIVSCLLGRAYYTNRIPVTDISVIVIFILIPSVVTLLLASANILFWKKVPFEKRASEWKQTLLTLLTGAAVVATLLPTSLLVFCSLLEISPSFEGFAKFALALKHEDLLFSSIIISCLLAVVLPLRWFARSYAATLGLCCLVIHCNKDDSHKDYYTVSLSRAVGSALDNLVLFLLSLGQGLLLFMGFAVLWGGHTLVSSTRTCRARVSSFGTHLVYQSPHDVVHFGGAIALVLLTGNGYLLFAHNKLKRD